MAGDRPTIESPPAIISDLPIRSLSLPKRHREAFQANSSTDTSGARSPDGFRCIIERRTLVPFV
jgi:hypothetical protein